MANKIMKTLTVENTTYEVVDSTARAAINSVSNALGDPTSLQTTNKDSLVEAINELADELANQSGGDDTEVQESIMAVDGKIGDLSGLKTDAKTNMVAALNEVATELDAQIAKEVIDTTARSAATSANTAIGDTATLQTADKTNVVSAINELAGKVSTEHADAQARAAIDMLSEQIGDISSLQTEVTSSVVDAINELANKDSEATDVSVTWDEVENKPFGTTPKTVVWSETTLNEVSGYKLGDTPFEVEGFLGATISYTLNNQTYEGKISNTLITDETLSSVTLADGEVAFVYDISASWDGLYYVCANDTEHTEVGLLAKKDVNLDASTMVPAGIWSPSNANDTSQRINSMTYAEYIKIPNAYLPEIEASGSGAFIIDLTSMTDANGDEIILCDEYECLIQNNIATQVITAAKEGKPILILATTEMTGDKIVALTGSVTIDAIDTFGMITVSGMLSVINDANTYAYGLYKFALTISEYALTNMYSAVNAHISDISTGLITPAANIKYIDYGSSTDIDPSTIDFTNYNAGDLILLLTDIS